MMEDDEFEMLLGEIHHHGYGDHRHGYGMMMMGSDCNSNGNSNSNSIGMYDDHKYPCASPVSGFSLQSDGSSSSLFSNGHSLSDNGSPSSPPLEDLKLHSSHANSNNFTGLSMDSNLADKNTVDELLSRSMNEMYITDQNRDQLVNYMNGFYGRSDSSVPRAFQNFNAPYAYRLGNLTGSPYSQTRSESYFYPSPNYVNSAMASPFHGANVLNHGYQMGVPRPQVTDHLLYAQQRNPGPLCFQGVPHSYMNSGVHLNPPVPNVRNKFPSHVLETDEHLNYATNKGYGRFRETRIQENGRKNRMHNNNFSLPTKFNSLAEARGFIYHIAKDQHGCRFLQRMLDEGTTRDVETIFYEVIDHVVELMMNPFGNYQMQKLLEVCNEEQRMEIILKVTQVSGELVRISLNTHGTRVVQKLIETLKTRQQVSLIISALKPGFLALVKDLNGNHVIQRCLQCLSYEDNKFIFVAAAKYIADIGTHQHGCCVLQRCIDHCSGEYLESLANGISANALLLAQDPFGNYVVQYIMDVKIPYAISKIVSQFEGSYAHLSPQKFSSHVVEKCLRVCNYQVRAQIIHELLSTTHFEQLLQDPHANYVVQTALQFSEGPLHDSLVEAIEFHKGAARNSPYTKGVFSHKLLKK